MKEVIVKDADLQQAAMEGMDAFLGVFTKAIYDAIGGELTAESMAELNADQMTLLSWDILHEELMDGGFVQLIYNGYGPFIFNSVAPYDKSSVVCRSSVTVTTGSTLKWKSMISCRSKRNSCLWNSCRSAVTRRRRSVTLMPPD